MEIKKIISDRKFSSFFWTQFLGAFNDNLFKNALVVMLTFRGIQLAGMDDKSLVALAGGLFILPFFLFSPLAGQLADKFEKSKLIRLVKLSEIGIMMLAGIGFVFQSYAILLFILFLMGVQSTFFGPVKYSIIPELVSEEELTEGNAFIELGTFLAILIGTLAGGLVESIPSADYVVGGSLILFAGLGYFTSRGVPKVDSGNRQLKIQWNPFPEIIELWKIARERKAVFNSVLGISWFWFFGAGLLSVLPIYIKEYLGSDSQVATLFLAMFTLGIGVGSILCEKLSFRQVEIGIVPIGSLGMTIFLVDLYLIIPPWVVDPQNPITIHAFIDHFSSWRLLFDFLMMSIFGGLFIVPLYTLIQERSDENKRSRVIAANNIINALFMVAASVLVLVFYHFSLNTAEIFGLFAVMNVLVAIYIYSIVPEFTLRFYSWILSHIMYKVKSKGKLNIPKDGACILACNHVTFVDWLILSGVCKRPARFVMYYKFFNMPILKRLFKQAKAIPIAGAKEDALVLNKAFNTIDDELKNGEVVFIFPEGQLTKTGKLAPFRPGIKKMVEANQCPVVPVVLKGLWGSIFSKKKNKDRVHRRLIEVEIFKPISPQDFRVEDLETLIAESLGETPPHKIKAEEETP